LPQIREEIREEFRTGSGSSNAGGNSPLQEVVLSSVFPSSGAGALEEGVSFHSSDKYKD
nr:hypothetical protein [Tanacetum cinerariifolium]